MGDPTAWLWIFPALPLVVAGITAILPRDANRLSAFLAIGSQSVLAGLSAIALVFTIHMSAQHPAVWRGVANLPWLEAGTFSIPVGFLLDPLTAVMLLMVTLVSLLVFLYSRSFMQENQCRFFCFLSLFSAGMLGILVSNSLLLLFAFWEIVGLSSYLLIGFWFDRPVAADAARKAFLTTRVGDLGFLVGMLWIYAESGTLLFYDGGAGFLEAGGFSNIVGVSQATAISLLLFFGAVGKSGQFPLHVWLPDAMEGPTPVSALIHAATMVAAGVFLVARTYPLFEITEAATSLALTVVTWTGAITALFAGLIASTQFDIKRILAYSTISQLGIMMLALGVGGWGAAIAHLIAHAFFKALLFLGAGSVVFGTHHTQDIRKLGGLSRRMPLTFVTYGIGMMALAGFPLFFSGFWTKEAVLHAAHDWSLSQIPFFMLLTAAFLTAFYMTRQMVLVFFGTWRGKSHESPHESPAGMVLPMLALAAITLVLSLTLTPAWPWLKNFTSGAPALFDAGALLKPGNLLLMAASVLVVGCGVGAAWALYGRRFSKDDPLEVARPNIFSFLQSGFKVDALYQATFVKGIDYLACMANSLDRCWISGLLQINAAVAGFLGRLTGRIDTGIFNKGFDATNALLQSMGRLFAASHSGKIQSHLTALALGVVIILLTVWFS